MAGILRRIYPFNAEQSVNLLSEFGPLITLFVVNAVYGVTAGIWALIGSTVLALIVMWIVLRRLPIFALIAGGITLVFSAISLYYDDPMWVQLKVTLFNAVFAAFLWIGLLMNKNFFKYTFEKSFHYTAEGWNKFTRSFIVLFLLLAAANEAIRLIFWHSEQYDLLGWQTDGLNVWVMFKIVIVMPITGLYAFVMTRRLQHYAIDPPDAVVPVHKSTAPAASRF
ncbi:MAG: inner membrane-spanning protein YciB [Hyphomicrobiaceae bacterium]